MGCPCNNANNRTFVPNQETQSFEGLAAQGDLVLMSYNGNRPGGYDFSRTNSGRKYHFEYGDSKYVMAQDVPQLLGFVGFEVVNQPGSADESAPELAPMVLGANR